MASRSKAARRGSGMGAHRRDDPDQVEEATRPLDERVLFERALAGAAAELLGSPRIVEQVPVGGHRLLYARDDEQLTARLEPGLDPRMPVGHDRRARHG